MRIAHINSCRKFAQGALCKTHLIFQDANMSVGSTIRRIRKSKNMTILELANQIGSDVGNISRLERGVQGYSQDILEKIAHSLDVKISDLFASESNTEELAIKGRVPLISWVAAGKWCNVSNPYEAGDAEDWIICPVKHSTKTYALKIKGDSMHNPSGKPSFDDGDIIFVDPARNFDHRSYVIVRLDDENQATFKRLLIDGDRRMLEALNPAWPNRIFEINEDATICGVVIARLESFL